MGTPPRKYNKRRRNDKKDGNNAKQQAPPSPSPSDTSIETACFFAAMMSVAAYAFGLFNIMLNKSSVEALQVWANTFSFFGMALALAGLLFAIVLSRITKQPSSSQSWKLSLALYPGMTYLLFECFMRYMPYADHYSLAALGFAFLLGLLGMAVLKN